MLKLTRPRLPAAFVATVTDQNGNRQRRFVRGEWQRVETVLPGTDRPVISIRRPDRGVLWVIHPRDRACFESKLGKLEELLRGMGTAPVLQWTEGRRGRIDGRLYRHYVGRGRSPHGMMEDHVYVDEAGMFRRERSRVGALRLQNDYTEIDLTPPADACFDYDLRGYKRLKR